MIGYYFNAYQGGILMHCTRCEGTGFLNLFQLEDIQGGPDINDFDSILKWLQNESNHDHDVTPCDCCGDGTGWYGQPGEHFCGESMDCYQYNGGLPECN